MPNKLEYYGFNQPNNTEEGFKVLKAISDKHEFWLPELAAECGYIIKQMVGWNNKIPYEKHPYINSIGSEMKFLGNAGKMEQQSYRNKFSVTLDRAISELEKYK